ncbi:hypothetical protein D3C76_1638160 [compost metagenome]
MLDTVLNQGLYGQLRNSQLHQAFVPGIGYLHPAAETGFLQREVTFDMPQLFPGLYNIPAADTVS